MSVGLLDPTTGTPVVGSAYAADQSAAASVNSSNSSAPMIAEVPVESPVSSGAIPRAKELPDAVDNVLLDDGGKNWPTKNIRRPSKPKKSAAQKSVPISEPVPSFEHLAAGRATGPRRYPAWVRRVRTRVALVDALAIYASVFAAFMLRWGMGEIDFTGLSEISLTNGLAVTGLILMAVWFIALAIADAWDTKLMGAGSAEYTRVWNTTFAVFGLMAISAYLTRWNLGRSYVAIGLPMGLILLGLGRWLMRVQLVRERADGEAMSKALIIGAPATVEHFVRELSLAPESGLNIVATCTPGSNSAPGVVEPVETTPLDGHTDSLHLGSTEPATSIHDLYPHLQAHLHSLDDVVPFVTEHDLDAVIVSGSDEVSPQVLKRLAWALEPHHVDLILAPELTDVSGTRTVTRNVAGLSLLHVDAPGYTSSQQNLKRVFDLVGSTLLIGVFALPLLVTAIAIKVTSRGPVLFKQTRIGENGKPFKVYKFRSMYADAEARLKEVLGGEVGLFYKPKNDPRITPVGKFIRRYSVDELPQLFNVLFSTMSLVGPRPQIPAEVRQYDNGIERRLFVKPGMTGLWQVSGRNNLGIEQSLALDLSYIENWSMTEDLLILAKTIKAVVGRDGAY